jgi:hypothetical protein
MRLSKIKLSSIKATPTDTVSKGTTIGANLFGDSNTEAIAQGTVIKTETVLLQTEINLLNTIRASLLEQEGVVKDQQIIVVQAMNDGAGIVSRVYRFMLTKWQGFGFSLTKVPTPTHVPVQPDNCKAVQNGAGKAKLTRKTDKGSYCRVYESIGVSTDFSTYYPANPDIMTTSKLVVIPKHLLTPTNYILIPFNGKGDGDPSAPFPGTFV